MPEDDFEPELALNSDLEKSITLIVYAVVMFGMAVVFMCFDVQPVSGVVLLGCAGGAFCQLWGMLGLFGYPFRFGATVTLSLIGLVLLSFSAMQWLPAAGDASSSPLEKILTTVMLLVTLALLGWLVVSLEEGEVNHDEARAGEDAQR